MLQDLFLRDQLNYQRYGLAKALDTIRQDYICPVCNLKYRNTKDMNGCYQSHKEGESHDN